MLLLLSSCTLSSGPTGTSAQNSTPPDPVLPTVSTEDLIAILPVDNLTGRAAPADTLGRMLRTLLTDRGLRLIDEEAVGEFMRSYRVRHTGGVDSRVSRGLKEETGAGAVLLTSLEIFLETYPPRVAMFSRLVAVGEQPAIVWMDGVGMSGDEFPGLLGIGRIEDPRLLLEKVAGCIADSLAISLSPTTDPGPAAGTEFNDCGPRGEVVLTSSDARVKRRHRPAISFRSPALAPGRRYSVAIIPFLNLSDRRNAGDIVALHFVNQMFRSDMLDVIEPGIVREQLLARRIIMEAGPSLENAEALSGRESLGADLVFSGSVFDYQDAVGVPKVDFSATLIQKGSSRVVWSANSHSTGEDGVFFFGQGEIHTAHRLASDMARGAIEGMH